MASISNKAQRPLSVPLPGGKTLHLGPGKTGQVAPKALTHPPLKKLIDAGELAVVDDGPSPTDGGPGARKGQGPMIGHGASGSIRRSGDR